MSVFVTLREGSRFRSLQHVDPVKPLPPQLAHASLAQAAEGDAEAEVVVLLDVFEEVVEVVEVVVVVVVVVVLDVFDDVVDTVVVVLAPGRERSSANGCSRDEAIAKLTRARAWAAL